MLAQTIISRVADWIPRSLKIGVRGNHDSPSRVANAIHSLLNRLPAERYPILECGGVLKGFRMRVDWQIHRSFAYGSWEPEVVDAIERNVTRGMTAIDIGAHGGFYSLLFSKTVGSAGRVFAFEPLPANSRVLEENILLNDIHNIFPRHEAVADITGELTFQFPHHNLSLV
ncbi:MAG: FkbM family methyltransferase, partial [Candidatus Acidiferrales bacterium]